MSRSVCSVPRCSGLTAGASGTSPAGREDLDPLDGVDAQVGVESHVQAEHLGRIARLLRHHGQQERRQRPLLGPHSRPRAGSAAACRESAVHPPRGRERLAGAAPDKEVDDVAESVQRAEMFGLDGRSVGDLSWRADRISTRLMESMPRSASRAMSRLEHVGRIARLLRDHRQESPLAIARPAAVGALQYRLAASVGGTTAKASDRCRRGDGGSSGGGGTWTDAAEALERTAQRLAGQRVTCCCCDQGLEGREGRLLVIEELLVELRRLLLHSLEREQALLRDAQLPGRATDRSRWMGRRIGHQVLSAGEWRGRRRVGRGLPVGRWLPIGRWRRLAMASG